MFEKIKSACAVPQVNVVGDKDRAEMQILHISRTDDGSALNARHTTAIRPFLVECGALVFSSVTCFFQFEHLNTIQLNVHGWNSSLSLTCGWHKVILSPLNGTNQIQERPHPLYSSQYFGMVYLSQEKTIAYYLEGYSFLLFVGVWGGEGWLNNHFVHRRSGSLQSMFSESNKTLDQN